MKRIESDAYKASPGVDAPPDKGKECFQPAAEAFREASECSEPALRLLLVAASGKQANLTTPVS